MPRPVWTNRLAGYVSGSAMTGSPPYRWSAAMRYRFTASAMFRVTPLPPSTMVSTGTRQGKGDSPRAGASPGVAGAADIFATGPGEKDCLWKEGAVGTGGAGQVGVRSF